MKKSVNKSAVALWILAATLFISETIPLHDQLLRNWQTPAGDGPSALFWVLEVTSNMVRSAVVPAILAAFGYCIELLDQIRWKTRRSDV